MQYVVGFIILCVIANALGIWFWLLLFAGAILGFVGWLCLEMNTSDEARLFRSQESHARRMAQIEAEKHRRQLEVQAEHERKQRKASMLGNIGGTAAKVGVSLAVKALTGANHNHRH